MWLTICIWIEATQLGRFSVDLFRFVENDFHDWRHQRLRAFSKDNSKLLIYNTMELFVVETKYLLKPLYISNP